MSAVIASVVCAVLLGVVVYWQLRYYRFSYRLAEEAGEIGAKAKELKVLKSLFILNTTLLVLLEAIIVYGAVRGVHG